MFGIPAVVVDRAVYPVVGGVLAATVVGTATATASDSTLPVAQCSSVADAALAAGRSSVNAAAGTPAASAQPARYLLRLLSDDNMDMDMVVLPATSLMLLLSAESPTV